MSLNCTPIVYSDTSFFKRSVNTSSLLPTSSCGPYTTNTLTWDDLNTMLFIAKNDATFVQQYKDFLAALINEDSTAIDALEVSMSATLKGIADQIISCSAFTDVRFLLENNASQVRASSDQTATALGATEYGRTEIIVAQQNVDIIANDSRYSSTTAYFSYYGCVAMGSYQADGEFPAHVLKIAATYSPKALSA